ncbi:hypothetical protein D3C76_40710 [compost metagenome]
MIGEKEYFYVINQEYKQNSSYISLKVSLKGFKNSSCTFLICTWDDPIMGSPLLVGVDLKNKQTNITERYNLHYPRTIRSFILYGLENGWTGENNIVFQDGLYIISVMGYDVSWLKSGGVF